MLLGHTDIVTDFASIPELDVIVTSSMDSSLRIWDMTNTRPTRTMRGHTKVHTSKSKWLGKKQANSCW